MRRTGSRDLGDGVKSRRQPVCQGTATRLPPLATSPTPTRLIQDRLPAIPSIPSPKSNQRSPAGLPLRPPDEPRGAVRPGSTARFNAGGGIVRRRATGAGGEKLDPIRGHTPSLNTGLLGPSGASLGGLSSGLDRALDRGLERPLPWAVPGAGASRHPTPPPHNRTAPTQERTRSFLDQASPLFRDSGLPRPAIVEPILTSRRRSQALHRQVEAVHDPSVAPASASVSFKPPQMPQTLAKESPRDSRSQEAIGVASPSGVAKHGDVLSPEADPHEKRVAKAVEAAGPSSVVKSGVAQLSEVEMHAKKVAKVQAVAALQRLFFEEVSNGCDPNAAAAKALLRLAEESRPPI